MLVELTVEPLSFWRGYIFDYYSSLFYDHGLVSPAFVILSGQILIAFIFLGDFPFLLNFQLLEQIYNYNQFCYHVRFKNLSVFQHD